MKKPKHIEAVDALMKEFVPKDPSISAEEHEKTILETFNRVGVTKQFLSDQFEIGVKQGVSIDEQTKRIRDILSNSDYLNK